MLRAALYVRISPIDQHPETLHDLRQLATQRGYEVVKEYIDKISSAKARHPALDGLLSDARRRQFDVVLTSSLTSMARSVKHCLSVLNRLNQLGIGFVSCQEDIDTTAEGTMGQALVVIVSALSELQRNLVVEAVKAGMLRCKLLGGRIGRRPLAVNRVEIVKDRALGLSLTDVAKKHGVSRGTVCRLVRLATGIPQSASVGNQGGLCELHFTPESALSAVNIPRCS
jgi:DNA invertase Pin-like site-specific DNA recombinase